MVKPENVKWLLSEWGLSPNQFLSFTESHQYAIVQTMTEREGVYEDRRVFREVAQEMLSNA